MEVVSNLTRVQLVVAQRGPGGGIQLNRSPEDIGLNEVIINTEKNLRQLDVGTPSGTKEDTAGTRLNSYLNHALQAYLEALGHFTLADVLNPQPETMQLLGLNEKAA